MLSVFDFSKKKIGVFDNYDALLRFITTAENQKLLEGGSSVGRGYWAFAEYSPEKLKHVCAWVRPGYLTTFQMKALAKNLGLIEICRGAALWEIPVTSDLDVEGYKKKFCLDYCQHRHWRLIETQGHKPPQRVFVGLPRYCHSPGRKSLLSQKSLDTKEGQRLKAELDSCVERLRQKASAEESVNPSTQNRIQKGRY